MKTDVTKLNDTRVKQGLRTRALAIIQELEDAGYRVKITEVIRTVERQRGLYAQGRTKAWLLSKGYSSAEIEKFRAQGFTSTKAKVTSMMFPSFHGSGRAMDIVFTTNTGVLIWDGSYPGYAKYGELCRKHGLKWGGGWKARDLCHAQWEGE